MDKGLSFYPLFLLNFVENFVEKVVKVFSEMGFLCYERVVNVFWTI